MAKHKGRGWHSKLLAAALGVTAMAAATSVWTAQADTAGGRQPEAGVSTPDARHQDRNVTKVAEDIAHASDRGARGVNITIDDGPDPTWTPQVLRLLKDNGVKATFCMVGTQAQAYPDLVKAVVAGGHRLCNHTVSHDTAMDKKSEAYQSQQILDAERMITKASGGVRPQYYRAPGGAFTPYSRHLAASRGCGRWAGTSTPRTSSTPAWTPWSPPSRARSPTGRPSSSTTRAETAPRPWPPSARYCPG